VVVHFALTEIVYVDFQSIPPQHHHTELAVGFRYKSRISPNQLVQLPIQAVTVVEANTISVGPPPHSLMV
jgi:hypothetical protein